MSKVFEVSFISDGRYFAAGTPIEDADIRPFMRKYLGAKGGKIKANNLRKNYNTPYYVNDDNEMTSPVVRREIAQMEIENEQPELDEIEANQPPNDAVAEAVAQAQEDYAANIERQKLNAQIAAEREDAIADAIREEQDEAVASGEYDILDSDPRPKPKVIGQSKASKPKSLFVQRQGKFVPASTVELIPGEVLYWHRKRDIGVSEKFIKHSNVQKGKHNE